MVTALSYLDFLARSLGVSPSQNVRRKPTRLIGNALTFPNPSIHIDHHHVNSYRFLSTPNSMTHQEFWVNAQGSHNLLLEQQLCLPALWYPQVCQLDLQRELHFGRGQGEFFVRHMLRDSNRASTTLAKKLDRPEINLLRLRQIPRDQSEVCNTLVRVILRYCHLRRSQISCSQHCLSVVCIVTGSCRPECSDVE